MTAELITIPLPRMDPREGAAVLERILVGVGALWQAGRFRQLLETPEGKAAVEAFEHAHLDVRAQLAEAVANGNGDAQILVRLPPQSARGALTFTRTILAMLSDPETAAAAGVAPLSDEDLAFSDRHLRPVEAAVAAHEFQQTRSRRV